MKPKINKRIHRGINATSRIWKNAFLEFEQSKLMSKAIQKISVSHNFHDDANCPSGPYKLGNFIKRETKVR
jgi:hypothetical protein